jgi:PAS domain S-box-containing protein
MSDRAPGLPSFLHPVAPGVGDTTELPVPDLGMLKAVLDSVPGRVVAVNTAFRYVYVNHEFLSFMGLEAGQVLGRTVAEVVGEEAFALYRPVIDRIMAGESMRWEGWRDYPAQGRRYVQETVRPYAAPGQPVSAILAFNRDLTELKHHEMELQARLAQLQATELLKSSIVDHALVALISTDAAGRVVEFNPAAETMFGHAREAVIGQLVSDLIVPERFRAAHIAGMRRIGAGGEAHVLGKRMEIEALRADGTEFPVEMVLWRTEVEGQDHFTASLSDLTDRRQAAREIERQREALRQSEKLTAMGSLLAGVAHELNNPLAIVMGRASLLESKCRDPVLQADAASIREAAERCGRIVRTFLSMARQKPGVRAPVQVNDMVRGAVDLLQYNLRTSGIVVDLRLAEGLPEVVADADQIGQVVLNLLVNAQQALGACGPPRVLRVETGVEATRPNRTPRVWLRVADNGPGVAAEHRPRIFDPFYTTKPEGAGTGLGLAVSRSVAREHGGELALEERCPFDTGASFRLSIPVAATEALAPEPPPLLALDTDMSVWRVLVVDDEPQLCDLLREVLEAQQIEVATAESGEVALELLQEARFDAVVCDLRMPGMDGPGLWRLCCERHPALARRFVFVTGDTLSTGAREFLQETGCTCIEKPFAPAELLQHVFACLEAPAPAPQPQA